MRGVTGLPAGMVDGREELTPMLSQYADVCEAHPDALVLFQVGDFYEAFCDAAEELARVLGIALTKREDSTGEYPMAGIPIDNAESYVEELLDAGYRVAVADQVEDPEAATGVVDRAVTRVVTPGTLTEDELLATDDNNYVACLAGEYALALLDVSTGDFLVTSADAATVRDEIERFDPAEAILAPEIDPAAFDADWMVTPFDRDAFEFDAAREALESHVRTAASRLESDAEVRACGALLAYAEYARGGEDGSLDYLDRLDRYDPRQHVLLDAVALRALEVFEPRSVHGAAEHTLVGVLDETASALGRRELTDWLRRPLVDREAIEARLDAVEEFAGRVREREAIHRHLRAVYDLERLIAKVSRGTANARDLRALAGTLAVVPAIEDELADVESDTLRGLRADLDGLPEVRDLIERAVREEPPVELTDGGVIRDGFDDELDDLRETARAAEEWVASLEERERERTGIDSLKVGHTAVHGYYIEVTKPNLDAVPDDYVRRQTLKNAERFYTPELKQREDEIVRAVGRAERIEYQRFAEVRSRVAAEVERVQRLAETLAALDVLVALAEVAVARDYVRPEIAERGIEIVNGRHPVVERVQDRFVPNDTALGEDGSVAVITGPNMSGKSTYLRQVALLCILAQIGSFVPADAARVGLVDRVFARVGASDDIAGGRSTFMVEMTELTDILRHATDRSLVLLDEVGRGTNTADGFAIARAVTEYIHDELGAIALFATHHHGVTAVADERAGVINRHFDASRTDGEVVFRHAVAPGPSSASYGVDVAELAGVPDLVVERARALVADADGGADEAAAEPTREPSGGASASPADGGMGGNEAEEVGEEADGAARDEVIEALRRTNVADTTPMEALELLSRLRRLAE